MSILLFNCIPSLVLSDTDYPYIPENKNHPVLLDLQKKILTTMKKVDAEALCSNENEGYGLKCSYKTQKFMIHTVYMGGAIGKEANPKIGPSYEGLIVELGIYDPQYPEQQANLFNHEIGTLYWTEYHDSYLIDQMARLKVWIRYGVRTDKSAINEIKTIIAETAETYKNLKDHDPKNR